MKDKISVFVISPFDCFFADGGAENICRILCLSLAKNYDVTILHSEYNKQLPLGRIKQHGEGLCSCSAFYLDTWTQERGEVFPSFCNLAKEILHDSKLLITFERTILGINIPQISILGGISYEHCKDIAKSQAWNKLIVPSYFIKEQCGKLRHETNEIQVIYNGINCNSFFKYNEQKTYTVLLPFRPDRGKGFFESIEFISKVNKIGKWGQYSILITRLDKNESVSFYNEVDRYANEHNVVIKYIPWGSSNEMNDIYNKSDFILSLGCLEEGFGLTTIESILSGRAVISRKIGATPEVLPPDSGIVFFESLITDESVRKTMDYVTSKEIVKNLSRGATYIKEKYNEERMCEEMKLMIKKYLSECL